MHFILLWIIHTLAWFVVAGALGVLRGRQQALALRSCVAWGLMSSLLHYLLEVYLT